jgi:alkylated DNA repair dioxygenase AlkB
MMAIVRSRLGAHAGQLAAHVNWYDGGRAAVQPHNDKKGFFIENADNPIWSFTLCRGKLRNFQVYKTVDGKLGAQIRNIPLGDGDLLVMGGDMQRHYMHGVKATSAKEFTLSRRINVTIRRIDETLVARHADKKRKFETFIP